MSGIIRAPRPARGWTEIQNDTLRDARLSFRARGVLARLLSNADGFRMAAHELAAESPGEGRQAVLTALRELREAGYIVQRRLQGDRGQWRTETYVYDTPQESTEVRSPDSGSTEVRSPDAGGPDVGGPDAGQPDRIEKEQKKKQEKEQEKIPPRESAGQRPANAGLRPARSGGGVAGSKYQTDGETGICLQVGNVADLQAMAEIGWHGAREIAAAVAQARAGEPSGRAYPSAVLRLLRRGGAAGTGTPAWAVAGAGQHASARAHEIDVTDEGETYEQLGKN